MNSAPPTPKSRSAKPAYWLGPSKYSHNVGVTPHGYNEIRSEVRSTELEQHVARPFHTGKHHTKYFPITGIAGTYAADLMFLDNYAEWNGEVKILLNIIEITSRYLYCYPLKYKSETTPAIKKWLNQLKSDGKVVTKLITDAGTEFVNKTLKTHLASKGVSAVVTVRKHTNGIVERVNKTVRELIERHLTMKFNISLSYT